MFGGHYHQSRHRRSFHKSWCRRWAMLLLSWSCSWVLRLLLLLHSVTSGEALTMDDDNGKTILMPPSAFATYVQTARRRCSFFLSFDTYIPCTNVRTINKMLFRSIDMGRVSERAERGSSASTYAYLYLPTYLGIYSYVRACTSIRDQALFSILTF